MVYTDEEDETSMVFTDDDDEEDRELQLAFEKGLLKPGLNREIEKRKYAHINNVSGLERKREQIKLDLPWIEELVLTCDPAPMAPELALQLEARDRTAGPENVVYDDFAREMIFYRLGQAAVLEGIPKLHKLDILTKRPSDYFAEMAKSDKHMHGVRKRLKHHENVLRMMEKSKRMRELKKMGKKVQTEKKIQRQEEKKGILDQLKKYRKGKINSLDFLEEDPEEPDAGGIISSKKQTKRDGKDRFQAKSWNKNQNPKRGRWKRNTAQDLDGPLENVGMKRKHNFRGMPKKNNNKRLGKNSRQMMRQSKAGGKRNKR